MPVRDAARGIAEAAIEVVAVVDEGDSEEEQLTVEYLDCMLFLVIIGIMNFGSTVKFFITTNRFYHWGAMQNIGIAMAVLFILCS